MTVPNKWKAAIVVGASSGIGEALARQLAAGGTKVALVARRAERLETLVAEIGSAGGIAFSCPHDVLDVESIPTLFQQITTSLGGLDLVVYSSGIMTVIEEGAYPTDRDVATIETNFTGAVAWLNEAATRFSRTGSGTIVGISSVAGERGRYVSPVYNATKAAMNIYLESLRTRMARRGVKIVTVKPGWVRTPLLAGTRTGSFPPTATPEAAAADILRAAAAGKRVAYVPPWWRWLVLVLRAIPSPVLERTKF